MTTVSPEDIARAARHLRAGGLVAFPSETVYGLGAGAYDEDAVLRVFALKKRPRLDPLIVHVSTEGEARQVTQAWPPTAHALARAFWPGPLTLILPKTESIPDVVTSGHSTVAVRVPSHDVARSLIREAGVPVAAPSANVFGSVSPSTGAHVQEAFGDREEVMILDGGACSLGVESTVVSLIGGKPALLRPGGVPLEALQSVVGAVALLREGEQQSLSPGRMPRHYATRTPFYLAGTEPEGGLGPKVGLLCFLGPPSGHGYAEVEVLSQKGDLKEAAKNLFSAMRRLDRLGLDAIVATPFPEEGLGLAILDRLRRAAA